MPLAQSVGECLKMTFLINPFRSSKERGRTAAQRLTLVSLLAAIENMETEVFTVALCHMQTSMCEKLKAWNYWLIPDASYPKYDYWVHAESVMILDEDAAVIVPLSFVSLTTQEVWWHLWGTAIMIIQSVPRSVLHKVSAGDEWRNFHSQMTKTDITPHWIWRRRSNRVCNCNAI